MRFSDEETGEIHTLFDSVELAAELQTHQSKFDCDHTQTEVRRRRVGGGALQIKHQCLRCGRAIGNPVKRNTTHDTISAFDEAMEPNYEQERKAERTAICRKHLKIQNRREASFQKEYAEYLASPRWADKRQKVLKRANGVCEGCLEQAAEQVHHTTYKHIFDEFMFELVALCKSCHGKLHDDLLPNIEAEARDDWEPPCCACRWQDDRHGTDWCGKFDVSVAVAMADKGPCGPKQSELEGLK